MYSVFAKYGQRWAGALASRGLFCLAFVVYSPLCLLFKVMVGLYAFWSLDNIRILHSQVHDVVFK